MAKGISSEDIPFCDDEAPLGFFKSDIDDQGKGCCKVRNENESCFEKCGPKIEVPAPRLARYGSASAKKMK